MIKSGRIGGTIAAADGALAAAKTQLDQLASDVATAYNTQHALGYGADGVNGPTCSLRRRRASRAVPSSLRCPRM